MAERNKNHFGRQLISFNPNFRIDTANPQMGKTGTDVYKIYGVSDGGNQSSISLSSSGLFGIYNDGTIQISGGTKNDPGREDIVIIGKSGNVSITADGIVRIYATDIMIEAERDIQMKAGRNISIKGGAGRIMIDSQRVDVKGTSGNLIEKLGMDFTKKVFEDSFVDASAFGSLVGQVVGSIINNVVDPA